MATHRKMAELSEDYGGAAGQDFKMAVREIAR
jgi:hypothetical protein